MTSSKAHSLIFQDCEVKVKQNYKLSRMKNISLISRRLRCVTISQNKLFMMIALSFAILIFIPRHVENYRVLPQISIPLSLYNSGPGNPYFPRISFEPRHFSLPPMSKVSETLGALGTLGRYILKRTRSPSNSISNSNSNNNNNNNYNYISRDETIGSSSSNDLYTSGSNQNLQVVPPTPSPLVVNPEEDAQLGDALYTLGRNVLGQNMTDSLVPVVQTVNSFGKFLPPLIYRDGRIILGSSSNSTNDGGAIKDVVCTTPAGNSGKCLDLSGCPSLLFDLTNLRKSLCFKSLFVPGVCCPDKKESPSPSFSTRRPIIIVTTEPTTSRPYRPTGLLPSLLTTSRPSYPSSPEDCGKAEAPSFRIVGGDKSTPGMWPWMAAIYLHGPKGIEFWCGGTLISKQYIMTAAHCTKDQKQKSFSPRQFTVRLGDYDLVKSDDFASPETYNVAEIIAHPEFSGMGFYNDVALLKLEREVEYNRFISPICLPTGRSKANSFVGTSPTVIGWGTNKYGGREHNALQEVKLPVWSNDDCDRAYFQPITDIFLCAGLPSGGKDACQGDSGGPLMLQMEDHRWTQIGIVSFGNRCAEPGYPGVYTRITKFTDWIQTNIK